MSTITVPDPTLRRCSREDYYRLGALGGFRDQRVERIRGEIVPMSPAGWLHVVGKSRTADELKIAFTGIGWVSEQSPMPTEDSDPEPDVAVYPGRMLDYTDHPTDPLLIVEVADTSLRYDTITKAELYAETGVRDYWVLDVDGRRLHVFRDPILTLEGIRYSSHEHFGAGDVVSPLAAPVATIRVCDLLP